MSQESGFNRLEATVQKLLTNYSALKAAKEELERTILQKDQQIEELNGKLTLLQSERGDISGRVDALLRQIEEWEKAEEEVAVVNDENRIEGDEASEVAGGDGDPVDSRQGNLFSVEP